MAVVPQIDFFMGRPVTDVDFDEERDEWYIEFEGNGRIYITDASYEMPEPVVLVGKKLSKQISSASELRLYFGTDENPTGTLVHLPPTGYEISDPNYKGGERVNPNEPLELSEAGFEPSAPGERVVDGPEESQEAVSGDIPVEGHQVLDSGAEDE